RVRLRAFFLNGTLAKLRDIKWLFSHAGGTAPFTHRAISICASQLATTIPCASPISASAMAQSILALAMAQPSRALLRAPHDKKIRRGIYRSVAALRADITLFIERHNADSKPFRWTNPPTTYLLPSSASVDTMLRQSKT